MTEKREAARSNTHITHTLTLARAETQTQRLNYGKIRVYFLFGNEWREISLFLSFIIYFEPTISNSGTQPNKNKNEFEQKITVTMNLHHTFRSFSLTVFCCCCYYRFCFYFFVNWSLVMFASTDSIHSSHLILSLFQNLSVIPSFFLCVCVCACVRSPFWIASICWIA